MALCDLATRGECGDCGCLEAVEGLGGTSQPRYDIKKRDESRAFHSEQHYFPSFSVDLDRYLAELTGMSYGYLDSSSSSKCGLVEGTSCSIRCRLEKITSSHKDTNQPQVPKNG